MQTRWDVFSLGQSCMNHHPPPLWGQEADSGRGSAGGFLGQSFLIPAGVKRAVRGQSEAVPPLLSTGPDGSSMVLRGACLLLCLLALAHISSQQNGKVRPKPVASKKGKEQGHLPCKETLWGSGGMQLARLFRRLAVL